MSEQSGRAVRDLFPENQIRYAPLIAAPPIETSAGVQRVTL